MIEAMKDPTLIFLTVAAFISLFIGVSSAHKCTHAYIHACMRAYIHYTHACILANMQAEGETHTRAYNLECEIHAYVYKRKTYVHKYMYIHTNIVHAMHNVRATWPAAGDRQRRRRLWGRHQGVKPGIVHDTEFSSDEWALYRETVYRCTYMEHTYVHTY